MNKIEENNIPKTKKKKFSVLKIALICFVTIILSVVGFIVITDIIADYPEPTDFYFVRYRFDFDTDTGTSTIYQYDANEDEVYEIGSVPGALARSAVNPEHTHIIGVLSGNLILYDLEIKTITKQVSLSELKERVGLEDVSMLRRDFDFAEDGNKIYVPMSKSDMTEIYIYDFKSDSIELFTEHEDLSYFEYANGNAYYTDDGNLYEYNIATRETKKLVSDIVFHFTISPDGEKILIYDNYTSSQSRLYLYSMNDGTLELVERDYAYSDIDWNSDTYVYEVQYPGLLCDVNPTIKINTSRFGPDKVIYRINGFMKGGTIYLVENPGQ